MTGERENNLPIVVGVGASAGGLEALMELVHAIPEDSGMSYVIVQHLAPDHKSIMDELLSSHTPIPVKKIEDGAAPEADMIFVIPAGPSVVLEGGRFKLIERDAAATLRTPIDKFFNSLAEECGRDSFCIVLSGTGTDGTEGLRAVKAAGGIGIVQDSDSARFPGMPDSAAATGLVDFVLKPDDMPSCIADIVEHRQGRSGRRDTEARQKEIEEKLDMILDALGEEGGADFTKYKPGTLVRRVDRRMVLRRQRTVDGYVKSLRREPEERARLLQDFMIGVTRFFRDPEAFEVLRAEAIEPLADSDQDEFRIWTPGCSSGEETYTVAMMMIEAMEKTGRRRALKVFGTDIDSAALRQARSGYFSEGALAEVGEARRERFFRKENGSWRVCAELRESCVFAPHNLVEDPPFSRLDLITCRNLLIYLTDRTQANVIPRFHYALNPGGFLMLGGSESIGSQGRYFRTIDRTHRIFKRQDSVPPGFSALSSERFETRTRTPRLTAQARPMDRTDIGGAPTRPDQTIETEAERLYLRRYAAPFLVVNHQDEVTYVSEAMADHVRPRKGAPSLAVEQFVAEGLRPAVQTALARARRNKAEAVSRNAVVKDDGEPRLVDVMAAPVKEGSGEYILVLRPVRTQGAADLEKAGTPDADDSALLEHELANAKTQLNQALADYESMEQELRTTNEELLSMNEELQSSNEELETSREELQSINEELETINAELTENNRQLARANSDLKNLFESTDVATLFLDSNRCVRLFTPRLTELFGVRDRDVGRPIADLASRVNYPELEDDAREVGRTLQPLEREVTSEDPGARTFIARVRPYRTVEDRIDGVVITFFEITQRKRNERQLEENAEVLARQYAELETLYDTIPVGLNLLDRELRYLRINERLAEINGYPAADHIGKTQEEMLPEIDAEVREKQQKVLDTGEPILGTEVSGVTPASDEIRHWIVDYYPVHSREGEVVAVGSAVREVTGEVRLRAALEESEARLRRLFDQAPAFIAMHKGPEHEYIYFNPALQDTLGGRPLQGRPIAEAVPELEGQNVIERFDHVFNTGEADFTEEFQASLLIDGEERLGWYRQILQPWYDARGHVGGVMSFAFEISDIVEARHSAQRNEERKELLLNELQHRVKNTLATTLSVMRFTARNADSIPDMAKKLEERLSAIARTHDVLTEAEWAGDSLTGLIRRELAPYADPDGDRVVITGEDVTVTPKQALSLSLALHELTTNAVKHGALKAGEGRVEAAIAGGAETIELVWRELGGPEIDSARETAPGFGSFLLERVLAEELRGETTFDLAKDGLVCTIRFPANGG